MTCGGSGESSDRRHQFRRGAGHPSVAGSSGTGGDRPPRRTDSPGPVGRL